MKKELLFKTYFLACSLFAHFQEDGGWSSLVLEEVVVYDCYDYLRGKITEKEFLTNIKYSLGLNKSDLKRCLKAYANYKKENII